jgi:hypothetical protein
MEQSIELLKEDNNFSEVSKITENSKSLGESIFSNSMPDTCNYDKVVINYVQQAILSMRALHKQCNIVTILKYLKETQPENEKIHALTEKCLTRQMELATRDGVLARKISSKLQSNLFNSNNSDTNKNRESTMNPTIYEVPGNKFPNKEDSKQVKLLNFLFFLVVESKRKNFFF